MCPTCAAKVAASRLAGEAVPPEILRAAKAAMAVHLRDGRVSEANVVALDAEIRAAARKPDYSPPDPYRDQLERLRRDLPSNAWPEPPAASVTGQPNDFTPPSAYDAALAKLRSDRR
jgi:hypothetical protein